MISRNTLIPEYSLVQKYNVPAPRYTSYPTAVEFEEVSNPEELITTYNRGSQRPLSLYFHIPFCFSLCWYCGCTKIITKDQDRGDRYLDDLEREMDLLLRRWSHASSEVVQIHFGGGTPTFLRPDQILRLGEAISSRFTLSGSGVEYSVEVDPRHCDRERAEALAQIGCNRASLGVQDTNPEVQEAIHRIQPFDQTAEATHHLRAAGIHDINFDLIYGLPRQTLDTFDKTLEDVLTLEPNRLAIYSYAHLPNLMPSQRLLNESEFPSPEMKLAMISGAVGKLQTRGMYFIGMDHFAREDDSLYKALQDGSLQRNFQGYSTFAETDMFALGMSGISQLDELYYQNSKDLGSYYQAIDNGKLPIVKKLPLTRDDRIRRDLIMRIMCRQPLSWDDFSQTWEIDSESYFRRELAELEPFVGDGLLKLDQRGLTVSETGRFFLRNMAMVFDARLRLKGEPVPFSKAV